MYLACRRCLTVNTTDLYPIKRLYKSEEEHTVYKGSFSLYKHIMWMSSHTLEYASDFIIHPDNFLDALQLQYTRGWGCCGNYGKPLLCICCDSVIGDQYLDCMGTKHLHLNRNKVVRKYKK